MLSRKRVRKILDLSNQIGMSCLMMSQGDLEVVEEGMKIEPSFPSVSFRWSLTGRLIGSNLVGHFVRSIQN